MLSVVGVFLLVASPSPPGYVPRLSSASPFQPAGAPRAPPHCPARVGPERLGAETRLSLGVGVRLDGALPYTFDLNLPPGKCKKITS